MYRVTLVSLVLFAFAMTARAEDPIGKTTRADLSALVQGNSAFALDLYARLRQEKESVRGNLFCSPSSISSALAMTYAGARGETAAEMAKVLHFRLDSKRLHPTFAELTRELNGHGMPRDYQLEIAHSLWGADDVEFETAFQDLIRSNYGCRLRPVEFKTDPNSARIKINRWVESRTNGKIKDLLHKKDVNQLTTLALVNAIYFKAAWKTPFEAKYTRKDHPFQLATGKSVPVALMQRTNQYNYLETDDLQAVELPYEGDALSMVILLPRKKDGLDKLEAELTVEKMNGWVAALKARNVEVGLPRFKMTSRFDLAEVLKAMGMPRAFRNGMEPQPADFSGMTTREKLFIAKVIHQAFVNVDEEGTEAAAATAVLLERTPAPPPEKAVLFRADHPFLFLVRDTRTGSLLFLGRVNDPTDSGETSK